MTSWTQLHVGASTADTSAELVLAFKDEVDQSGIRPHSDRVIAIRKMTGFAADAGRWLDAVGDEANQKRLLIMGADSLRSADPHRWAALGGHLFDAMTALRLESIRMPRAEDLGGEAVLEDILLGALLHSYRLEQGRALPRPGYQPQDIVVDRHDASCGHRAERVANAVNRARAWVEQPANLLTPTTFAEESHALEKYGLTVRVLEPEDLEELNAGAILAVGRGAEHGPRLVAAEWRGDPEREGWDAVLVGKGLTFDGGGLNLKVRPVIEKMKFDMSGGAAVLGSVQLAASRASRCNVVALVPMVENSIDALSYRPGDVIKSMAGLTIEVVNTDAEGRIVLADALTYGQNTYAPRFIVDVATLTSAVTGVLHEEFAGYYASDEDLAAALALAGDAVGERLWRLPLDSSQDYLVDSEVADVANFGTPGLLGLGGGSCTVGAKFLQRFVPGARWAHIDIAGSAWATRRHPLSGKGATGFGVRLLDRWLAEMEAQKRTG
jgi:leucyl aminopeptidase